VTQRKPQVLNHRTTVHLEADLFGADVVAVQDVVELLYLGSEGCLGGATLAYIRPGRIYAKPTTMARYTSAGMRVHGAAAAPGAGRGGGGVPPPKPDIPATRCLPLCCACSPAPAW
jgi:hypothetical protein